jgi:hypothetical protein
MERVALPVYSALQMQTMRLMLAAQLVSLIARYCILISMLIYEQIPPAEDPLKEIRNVQIPVGLCGKVFKAMASAAK